MRVLTNPDIKKLFISLLGILLLFMVVPALDRDVRRGMASGLFLAFAFGRRRCAGELPPVL